MESRVQNGYSRLVTYRYKGRWNGNLAGSSIRDDTQPDSRLISRMDSTREVAMDEKFRDKQRRKKLANLFVEQLFLLATSVPFLLRHEKILNTLVSRARWSIILLHKSDSRVLLIISNAKRFVGDPFFFSAIFMWNPKRINLPDFNFCRFDFYAAM